MLAVVFTMIACIYSTVGFGGGSSYLALLSISEIPYSQIPIISLICNLIVTSSGCFNFYRAGYFRKDLFFPLILSSVPMAFIGGSLKISQSAFLLMLAITLLFSGIRLLMVKEVESIKLNRPSPHLLIFSGAGIGLISGMVGIGGGIFLSPLLINLSWAKTKEAATLASFFIWVNSLSGLIGQLIKSQSFEILAFWPLFLGVILGGYAGSFLGSGPKLTPIWSQKLTGLLILIVVLNLGLKIF